MKSFRHNVYWGVLWTTASKCVNENVSDAIVDRVNIMVDNIPNWSFVIRHEISIRVITETEI